MRSLRTAVVLTLTAAAAAVAPAGAAIAASPLSTLPAHGVADALPTEAVTGGLGSGVSNGVAPVKNLTLDPLANTGVDPLDNGLGSQVADFQPLSTAAATDPLTRGGSLATLPVVGPAAALLPG